MLASDLLVECLKKEGVEYIFGIPGEETLYLMESLRKKRMNFIPTRHEQGAAFMANVYGRLTGKPGVCLATLGPGASNLLTGVADAYLDRAPLVAITAQASLKNTHKESHQYVDIVKMFQPATKWNIRVERPEVIPEIVRKAFKIAQLEKPGATHIEVSDDIAKAEAAGSPLISNGIEYPLPNPDAIKKAASIIRQAKNPIILVGNGVTRRRAAAELKEFAERLQIPITNTFMGKGSIDYRNPLSLFTVGLQARDWIMCGFDRADVVIAIGYDFVEYSPDKWNYNKDKKIIHLDVVTSEIDEYYMPEVEIVAEIKDSLKALTSILKGKKKFKIYTTLRETILKELTEFKNDNSFPMKPQKVVSDLRAALGPEDILISDVGAHKLWIARMFPTHRPNTVLISNGYAAMGIALPGGIAAKLVHPERNVVVVAGDGGFLMTASELETAKRLGIGIVIIVWVDNSYGLIEWKQKNQFGKAFGVYFKNPDFVKYAESFGIKGFRVSNAREFLPLLRQSLGSKEPVLIEIPIDYSENLKLTEKLGHIICPI
ncbi:MAG: acetolactate synthase large subunit [Nitrospirae bacterium]|nr:acetolactate synthase large subunit [Nitrospirota bacterium]